MSKHSRAAWLFGGALLAVSALSLQAQQPAAPARPSASVDAARAAFKNVLFELMNVGGADRINKQLDATLAADPNFGMARVLQALRASGTTPAQRQEGITEAMGQLGDASAAEVLLATYWREQAAGRGQAALPILKTAAELAPTDADINYIYFNTQGGNDSPAQQVQALKDFVRRFPNFAAAYNALAYTSWAAGDGAGALAAVQKYEQLAPNHPNSHDSYADILLLVGRGQEGIAHMQRAAQLDPNWPALESKLGAIALTMNDIKGARSHFEADLQKATTPGQRTNAEMWLATTDLYQKNAKAALQRVKGIADRAKAANASNPEMQAHQLAAIIEAYAGNKNNVQPQLAAAEQLASTDAQKSGNYASAAVALSRIGRADEARAAASQHAALSPDDDYIPVIDAMLALDRKDYSAAEAALAKAPMHDVLPRELKAELLIRTGKKAEGEALKKEVMAASPKQDGNPPVNIPAVIARLRLNSM